MGDAATQVLAGDMERWRCVVAYDGTTFSGWQSQPGGEAVQDVLERRLGEIFKRAVRIHGSGRTDAGVHARGQVFHFDARWEHGGEKLLAALRVGLPASIQVTAARRAGAGFHARYSARGKRYVYEVKHGGFADPFCTRFVHSVPVRLEVGAMRAAAVRLTGRHDFRAFSAKGGEEREDTVRTVWRLELKEGAAGRLRLIFEGDGFLYKMVRSMTGALLAVGTGRMEEAEVGALLAAGVRTRRVETAPAQGLCLERVYYAKPQGSEGGRDG